MRALAVVVLDIDAQDSFELAATDDQEVVEALRADGADETLGVGVRLRRSDRRLDHADVFAAEHFMERGGELAVAVVDQEAHPLEQAGEAEVARLLEHPVSGRVCRAAGEVDAPAAELDEEEHVEAAQRDRLDGKEVAGDGACGLLANERRPGCSLAAWRRVYASTLKHSPHRARGEAEAELDQLTSDPLIAPARVLPRQPHHQLAQRLVRRWTAGFALLVCPLPAHQLPMPTQ